jgi:hypothetical protein
MGWDAGITAEWRVRIAARTPAAVGQAAEVPV